MRLRGGKVLLDLTSYGKIDNLQVFTHDLSKEETKLILEKGLIVKINFFGLIVTKEIIFDRYSVNDNALISSIFFTENDDSYEFWLIFNLNDNQITIELE